MYVMLALTNDVPTLALELHSAQFQLQLTFFFSFQNVKILFAKRLCCTDSKNAMVLV